MAYDAKKDVTLAESTNEEMGLSVSASQYDGGPVKIGIQRFYDTKQGERKWAKLGRLTLEEAIWVAEEVGKMTVSAAVQSGVAKDISLPEWAMNLG